MNTYVITFHRTYEIDTDSEDEALERAYAEFDTDMELGLATSNPDDFSYSISCYTQTKLNYEK